MRVEADAGGEAKEGVLLLDVVTDDPEGGAPGPDEVRQVRGNALRTVNRHAPDCDRGVFLGY